MLEHFFIFAFCLFTSIFGQPPTPQSFQYEPQPQNGQSQKTVIMRLEPLPTKPSFMRQADPPRAVPQAPTRHMPSPAKQSPPISASPARSSAASVAAQNTPSVSTPSPVAALQPVLPLNPTQQKFSAREEATPPPAPPMNIPTDVQNQLIKFLGLDSFGIPGLTGSHPEGFAGAVKELRSAGIPVQGMPLEHIGGQTVHAPQNEALVQANPKFGNELNTFIESAKAPFNPSGSSAPLPDAKPGENGLIGLLSTSVRKIVKDTGMADALSNSLPNLLGTNSGTNGAADTKSIASALANAAESTSSTAGGSAAPSASSGGTGIRRQQSPAERAIAGFASALGGGGNANGPAHAGLPRIPGIPILPGGIPRNSQGQIDVVQLIGSITRRVSNGTTLADVIPPDHLQTLADNVTDALLPSTPEDFELSKFMGRWFEGINSPRATEQRCIVHHYGGLTKNEKTATFTALKIYRDGSEFGAVKYSIGYAFRAGNKDAMLQLHSSENSDAQPFWVYKLGPEGTDPFGNKQYEYAIISNWVKYPVTVLVRDPDSFKAKHEVEVLRWLEDQGFINGFIRAFNMLQPASYGSCQYADNTFELFGRKR
uniref:Lipocalin domain-containing protein n=1 Tax=Globodera pallida TaxID=36090 RepID=A0A183BVY9_GLOPA